jgi:hypothetical protein
MEGGTFGCGFSSLKMSPRMPHLRFNNMRNQKIWGKLEEQAQRAMHVATGLRFRPRKDLC